VNKTIFKPSDLDRGAFYKRYLFVVLDNLQVKVVSSKPVSSRGPNMNAPARALRDDEDGPADD
jgi:hypothetical protein